MTAVDTLLERMFDGEPMTAAKATEDGLGGSFSHAVEILTNIPDLKYERTEIPPTVGPNGARGRARVEYRVIDRPTDAQLAEGRTRANAARKAHKGSAKSKPAAATAKKARAPRHPPPPELRSTLQVTMVGVDHEDDGLIIGVRNGQTTWMCKVIGRADA